MASNHTVEEALAKVEEGTDLVAWDAIAYEHRGQHRRRSEIVPYHRGHLCHLHECSHCLAHEFSEARPLFHAWEQQERSYLLVSDIELAIENTQLVPWKSAK